MSAKQTLLDWLAKDDFEKVFQCLFSLTNKYKDEALRNNATFQSVSWNALEKQRIIGTISNEEDHLETAKIRQALLQIIQRLPDDWTIDGMENVPATNFAASKNNWKKYAAYLAATIALLAGIAEISGYSIRDFFEKKESTEKPIDMQPPSHKANTSGDGSPAVITDEGDVNINYGDTKPKKDSITNK